MARKIELLETTIDENGHPVSSEVVHPLTSADCVVMENGATLDKVMGDGIATPTVTHESASFQVGVGDSNIEVVDGDVAGMTLEGKSYHNILPKPTTLIMETDEKEFKINDKIDNSIVLNDNVAEIATIKGKTYVNVIQEESVTEYIALGEELSGQSITTTGKPEGIIKGATLECDMSLVNMTDEAHTISIGGTVSGATTHASLQTKFTHTKSTATVVTAGVYNAYISLRIHGALLKPSTSYFVRIGNYTNSKGLIITEAEFKEMSNIISTFTKLADNVFKVTTNSEFTTNSTYTIVFENSKYNQEYEVGDSWSASNIVICEYQEGMENLDIPYFDGIGSVKSPKLLATGKNLFDGILAQGYIGDSSGEANTSSAGVHSPNYMKVKPNTTYTRTITGNRPSDFTGRVYFYDINKTYINSYIDGAIFTTPENAQYMRFRYHVVSGEITPDSFSESNIQIEEGSVGTSYEPYKGITIEQDIDSIPLTSDMFEQGGWVTDPLIIGMSMQQVVQSNNNSSRIRSKSLIPVKPNCKYILNGDLTGWGLSYDKNGGYVATINNIETFTTTSNTYYITPVLRILDNSDITPSDLDSMNLILQEVTDEIVLRSIGDVKDTLNLTTGEYVQRIGEVVLDGSESWVRSENSDNKTITSHFHINGNSSFYTDIKIKLESNLLVPTFVNSKESYTSLETEAIKMVYEFWININKNRLEQDSIDGFKKYLSQNPVKVQYVLATPIIKKVNLTNTTKLPSYTSTAHYDTIVPSNSLVPNIKIPSTIDYNVAIKPSTQYTIRANTTSAMSVNLGGSEGILANGKVVLTTPSTLAHNSLKLGNGKAKEVMVIEGSEIKDNVPFFNGMKNVQMGGIKLVNIARISKISASVTANANKTQFTFTPNQTSWGHIVFDNTLLKPNTKYTVFINIIKNDLQQNADNVLKIQLRQTDASRCSYVKKGFTGLHKVLMTTVDEDKFNSKDFGLFFVDTTSDSSKQMVIQNIMIFEGDWTHLDEIPFIESEMIIEQPIIRSTSDDGIEPFKHQTLYSNRVIGYEENCYYTFGGGAKVPNDGINSMLADVEGLSIAYATGGSSSYTFWDKDDVFISGKQYLDTSLSSYDKNGFITVPSNAKYMRFASGGETNAQPLYKVATVTGELPLRSLPNGVCDSFNLVTGEYVQRVGEVVLDGVNVLPKRKVEDVSNNVTSYFDFDSKFVGAKNGSYAYADKFIYENYLYNDDRTRYAEGIRIGSDGWGSIRIFNTRLKTVDKNGFVAWLKENPITVQYELATPIVRKIGLTAKGVFTEASLGDYDWEASPTSSPSTTRYRTTSAKSLPIVYNTHLFTEDFDVRHFNIDSHGDYEYISNMEYGQYVNVRKERLESDTVESFKKWLAQNPIKVGYITWKQTSSSYSNIQKPIFFNNVNVQFMNNNVDIQPSLTLQARSMNSYVMNMMKANARYTLKALKNSNSFTIDGTSYGAGTNGTFTSPSTLTNKLLITGQDVQELMIIEGDVTGKQLPYYKGVRSAYDSANRVEMLSQTRNLFNYKLHKSMEFNGINFVMLDAIWEKNNVEYKLKPNTKYTLRLKTNNRASWIHIGIDGANESTDIGGFTDGWTKTFTTNSTGKVTIGIHANTDSNIGNTLSEIQLEEGTVATPYQPHEENTTIINMPTRHEVIEVLKVEIEKGSVLKSNGTLVEDETMRRPKNFIPVEPNTRLTFINENLYRAENVIFYDIDKNYMGWLYTDGSGDLVVPDNCYFIKFYSGNTNTNDLVLIKKQDKPIALNELPNGVKDEILIKPSEHKAKLIQRVGKVIMNGYQDWKEDITDSAKQPNTSIFYSPVNTYIKPLTTDLREGALMCNKYAVIGNLYFVDKIGIMVNTDSRIYVRDNKCSLEEFKEKLKQEPIILYYELAEPIEHEILLNGYPFIYKDGSIMFNTDIEHITKVKYNVGQDGLINNQNETIIRHDKQISDLYDYIEIYLDEIYRMELFKMQLELSL